MIFTCSQVHMQDHERRKDFEEGGFYKLLETDFDWLLSRFWLRCAETVAGYDSSR